MPRFEYPSLRQGLVGAWCPSLGASGLTLIDRSGRNRNAIFVGGVALKATPGGLSVGPNGTTGYVETSTNCGVGSATNAALSFWASRAATSDNVIVGLGGVNARFEVYWANNGNAYWHLENGSQSYPNCPASGLGPFHFVWQLSSGVASAWINGVQQTLTAGGAASSSAISLSAGTVRVGWEQITNTFSSGFVDDLRIYQRALTPAEIRLLASRRGIGLSPLPDRGGGLPRKLSVNVGGSWRPSDAYINVGGTWKLAQASTNVAGTWR